MYSKIDIPSGKFQQKPTCLDEPHPSVLDQSKPDAKNLKDNTMGKNNLRDQSKFYYKDIAIISAHGSFGDDEGFIGPHRYTKILRAVVSSCDTEIYKISKKVYLQHIGNTKLVAAVVEGIEQKLKRREKMIKGCIKFEFRTKKYIHAEAQKILDECAEKRFSEKAQKLFSKFKKKQMLHHKTNLGKEISISSVQKSDIKPDHRKGSTDENFKMFGIKGDFKFKIQKEQEDKEAIIGRA